MNNPDGKKCCNGFGPAGSGRARSRRHAHRGMNADVRCRRDLILYRAGFPLLSRPCDAQGLLRLGHYAAGGDITAGGGIGGSRAATQINRPLMSPATTILSVTLAGLALVSCAEGSIPSSPAINMGVRSLRDVIAAVGTTPTTKAGLLRRPAGSPFPGDVVPVGAQAPSPARRGLISGATT